MDIPLPGEPDPGLTILSVGSPQAFASAPFDIPLPSCGIQLNTEDVGGGTSPRQVDPVPSAVPDAADSLNPLPSGNVEPQDDPNRYSPSRATTEDEVPRIQPRGPRTAVLGKAQAKKRLLAFSMTKQGGGSGLSFGFARKVTPKVNAGSAKAFAVGATPEEEGGVPPVVKKKGSSKKGPTREDRARAVVSAIEEIKREEQLMRGVMGYGPPLGIPGDIPPSLPLLGQGLLSSGKPKEDLEPNSILSEQQKGQIDSLIDTLLTHDVDKKSNEKSESDRDASDRRKGDDDGKRDDRRRDSGKSRRSKERRRSKDRHSRRDREKEEKKNRPTELPADWQHFHAGNYKIEEIRRLKLKLEKKTSSSSSRDRHRNRSRDRRSRSRDREYRKRHKSPHHDSEKSKKNELDCEHAYKPFETPSRLRFPFMAVGLHHLQKEYPQSLIRYTRVRPPISYSENPSISKAFYRTRSEVMVDASARVVEFMKKIIENSSEHLRSDAERSDTTKQADTNLSSSLAALQVSYDETEIDENMSSSDDISGVRKERSWYIEGKVLLSMWDQSGEENGVTTTELEVIAKKEKVDEEESEGNAKKENSLDLTDTTDNDLPNFLNSEKDRETNLPDSLENSIVLLPAERTTVRSKWDSDYEEDKMSVEETNVSIPKTVMEEVISHNDQDSWSKTESEVEFSYNGPKEHEEQKEECPYKEARLQEERELEFAYKDGKVEEEQEIEFSYRGVKVQDEQEEFSYKSAKIQDEENDFSSREKQTQDEQEIEFSYKSAKLEEEREIEFSYKGVKVHERPEETEKKQVSDNGETSETASDSTSSDEQTAEGDTEPGEMESNLKDESFDREDYSHQQMDLEEIEESVEEEPTVNVLSPLKEVSDIAALSAPSVEGSADLKLVSEYEEFMKAVSFDTTGLDDGEEHVKTSTVLLEDGNDMAMEESESVILPLEERRGSQELNKRVDARGGDMKRGTQDIEESIKPTEEVISDVSQDKVEDEPEILTKENQLKLLETEFLNRPKLMTSSASEDEFPVARIQERPEPSDVTPEIVRERSKSRSITPEEIEERHQEKNRTPEKEQESPEALGRSPEKVEKNEAKVLRSRKEVHHKSSSSSDQSSSSSDSSGSDSEVEEAPRNKRRHRQKKASKKKKKKKKETKKKHKKNNKKKKDTSSSSESDSSSDSSSMSSSDEKEKRSRKHGKEQSKRRLMRDSSSDSGNEASSVDDPSSDTRSSRRKKGKNKKLKKSAKKKDAKRKRQKRRDSNSSDSEDNAKSKRSKSSHRKDSSRRVSSSAKRMDELMLSNLELEAKKKLNANVNNADSSRELANTDHKIKRDTRKKQKKDNKKPNIDFDDLMSKKKEHKKDDKRRSSRRDSRRDSKEDRKKVVKHASVDRGTSSDDSYWEENRKKKDSKTKESGSQKHRKNINNADAEIDAEVDMKKSKNVKKRRRDRRSRSASPAVSSSKKRRRSPSTSPEHSPTPQRRSSTEGKSRNHKESTKERSGESHRLKHDNSGKKKGQKQEEADSSEEPDEQKERHRSTKKISERNINGDFKEGDRGRNRVVIESEDDDDDDDDDEEEDDEDDEDEEDEDDADENESDEEVNSRDGRWRRETSSETDEPFQLLRVEDIKQEVLSEEEEEEEEETNLDKVSSEPKSTVVTKSGEETSSIHKQNTELSEAPSTVVELVPVTKGVVESQSECVTSSVSQDDAKASEDLLFHDTVVKKEVNETDAESESYSPGRHEPYSPGDPAEEYEHSDSNHSAVALGSEYESCEIDSSSQLSELPAKRLELVGYGSDMSLDSCISSKNVNESVASNTSRSYDRESVGETPYSPSLPQVALNQDSSDSESRDSYNAAPKSDSFRSDVCFSLDNIPLPPPIDKDLQIEPEKVVDTIPVPSSASSEVAQKPVPEENPPSLPPPLLPPPEPSVPQSRPKHTVTQKHVITVKLLSPLSRLQAAATESSNNLQVQSSIKANSSFKLCDPITKTELTKGPLAQPLTGKIEGWSPITTIVTDGKSSVPSNTDVAKMPWRAVGGVVSETTRSSLESSESTTSEVSSSTPKSLFDVDTLQTPLGSVDEAVPKERQRKRPSRWGMTTAPAKKANIEDLYDDIFKSETENVVVASQPLKEVINMFSDESKPDGTDNEAVKAELIQIISADVKLSSDQEKKGLDENSPVAVHSESDQSIAGKKGRDRWDRKPGNAVEAEEMKQEDQEVGQSVIEETISINHEDNNAGIDVQLEKNTVEIDKRGDQQWDRDYDKAKEAQDSLHDTLQNLKEERPGFGYRVEGENVQHEQPGTWTDGQELNTSADPNSRSFSADVTWESRVVRYRSKSRSPSPYRLRDDNDRRRGLLEERRSSRDDTDREGTRRNDHSWRESMEHDGGRREDERRLREDIDRDSVRRGEEDRIRRDDYEGGRRIEDRGRREDVDRDDRVRRDDVERDVGRRDDDRLRREEADREGTRREEDRMRRDDDRDTGRRDDDRAKREEGDRDSGRRDDDRSRRDDRDRDRALGRDRDRRDSRDNRDKRDDRRSRDRRERSKDRERSRERDRSRERRSDRDRRDSHRDRDKRDRRNDKSIDRSLDRGRDRSRSLDRSHDKSRDRSRSPVHEYRRERRDVRREERGERSRSRSPGTEYWRGDRDRPVVKERDSATNYYLEDIPLPVASTLQQTPSVPWTNNAGEADMELSCSPASSPLVGFKRSLADSTISDSELISSKQDENMVHHVQERMSPSSTMYRRGGVAPATPYLVQLAGGTSPQEDRGEASPHDSPPTFSPKRLSLDERLELELGVKKSPPPLPPIPQQQHQVYHQQSYPYTNYYQPPMPPVQQYDKYGPTPPTGPAQYPYPPHGKPAYVSGQMPPPLAEGSTPKRRPSLLPTPNTAPLVSLPANLRPVAGNWDSPEAFIGTQQCPNSRVVQVGNVLQVVPAEMQLPGPAPSPASSVAPPLPPQSIVLQAGNMLQVIPSDSLPCSLPSSTSGMAVPPSTSQVVQVGNMLQVIPGHTVPTPPLPSPVAVPAPIPVHCKLASPSPLVSSPLQTMVAKVPLPLPSFSPPASPFLVTPAPSADSPAPVVQQFVSPSVQEVITGVSMVSVQGECSIPFLSTLEMVQEEVERRRMERERRRQEKEKRRQEKERRRQKKLKAATEIIIKKALEQEGEILVAAASDIDIEEMRLIEEAMQEVPETEEELPTTPKRKRRVPLEVRPLPPAGKGILVSPGFREKAAATANSERKTVKFADGVHPGEGTSPSAGEDLPSPPPPPRTLPKEKRFKKKKKKKIKVKIIRQINVEEDDDDDDISPPPPPPGSPPPPPMFPPAAHYPPAYAAPVGFTYTTTPSYTVLPGTDGSPAPAQASTSGTAVYTPLYQHHHTTTTTHTTTVQFAPPPPPPATPAPPPPPPPSPHMYKRERKAN